jgi:hypothetical protein
MTHPIGASLSAANIFFFVFSGACLHAQTNKKIQKKPSLIIEIICLCFIKIVSNARVYNQLRLQSANVSSYTDIERSVTDVSVMYVDSDAQTLNQAIGYTRCCGSFYLALIKSSTSMSACFKIALKVPSGMSPV